MSWLPFATFALSNTLAALLSPIQDCDEVFNYWEPSHYLNHGYGFQTWEYSPEFAIRSWAYATLHSIIIATLRPLVGLTGTKAAEFYALRIVLGLVCAACQTRLYGASKALMGGRIATLFLVVSASSTGLFHAAPAYLPSSFAMYMAMLGASVFMDWKRSSGPAEWILWFAIGAIVGWPFAAALAIPFVVGELASAAAHGSVVEMFFELLAGVARSALILIFQGSIDAWFYRQKALVPWNIVEYNILSDSSKGPSIYGTEPWDYYLRNLALNFGVWLPIAFLALPLVTSQAIRGRFSSKEDMIRTVTAVTPFYIWVAIFSLQPHKEERFMYPVYPFLALNAAASLHVLLHAVGNIPRVPPMLKLAGTAAFFGGAVVLSLLRSASLVSGYTAPLSVYKPLQTLAQPGDTVCLGKEWYRFPSHYFLPDGVRAKFIKSEFSGLLPGEFHEGRPNLKGYPGAFVVPNGMNDLNIEDPAKYTPISNCTFLVDSHFPSTREPSKLEPDYVNQSNEWKQVRCEKFLDAPATGILGRLFWLPEHAAVPSEQERHWAEYCLLQRI